MFYRKKTFKLKRRVLLQFKKYFLDNVNGFENTKVNEEIDVVIPCIQKDLDILPYTIKSLKKFSKHKINKIYLVSPVDKEIINFCKSHSLECINEEDVLGYGAKDITYNFQGIDRSGWFFQQLLKLSGQFVSKDNYLVIDSDTVLLRPHAFIKDGIPIFYESKENYAAYYDTFYSIFAYHKKHEYSFVSHMMIMNKSYLEEMKKEIESLHQGRWDKILIQHIDQNEISCFSEFETYANWVQINKQCFSQYNFNLSIKKGRSAKALANTSKYSKKYKSLSFHSWNT